MAERAGLFEDAEDFDVAGFAPKKPTRNEPAPPTEAIRAVSEASNFRSREPGPAIAAPPTGNKREPRRHRTGRNVQFNVKLRAETIESFYELSDQLELTLGEVVERAQAALKTELATQK